MPDMLCNTCGNPVHPTDHFCRKCGSPSEFKTETSPPAGAPQFETGQCAACGGAVLATDGFCHTCGTKQGLSKPTAEPAQPSQPQKAIFTGKVNGRRARITEHPVTVRLEPSASAAVLADLPIGSEVELGKVNKVDDQKWIDVTLPSGEKGYLPGSTRVFMTQQVELVQNSVAVHGEPAATSAVTTQMAKGEKFYTIDLVSQLGAVWYKIRQQNGSEGYIEKATKVIVSDATPKSIPLAAVEQSPEVVRQQTEKDWFIEIVDTVGEKHFYGKDELKTTLRTEILQGRFLKDTPVVIRTKDKAGVWTQAQSTLLKFAKGDFPLRILYEPVWAYAMEGLKWGIYAAVGLKALDTAYSFFSANFMLGVLFLGALAAIFIPKIGAVGSMAIIIVSVKLFPGVNIYMTVIAAMLVGAILGCLPGIAIGGMIGLIKKPSLPLAKDAAPEPAGLAFKVVFLPFIGGCMLLAFYFLVVNPWLIQVLS